MNKQGQGVISFVFYVLVFVILWFVWIGKWIGDVGQQAIIDGQLTGFEAFFFANLNIWIMVSLILGILGFMYFVGRSQ